MKERIPLRLVLGVGLSGKKKRFLGLKILVSTLGILTALPGCQPMNTMLSGIDRIASIRLTPVRKAGEREKNRDSGYLSRKYSERGKTALTSEEDGKNFSRPSLKEPGAGIKDSSRLEQELLEQKKGQEKAHEELENLKNEFSQKIFAMENQLDQQKAEAEKARKEAVEAQFDALKARQELDKIKLEILSQKSLFNSSFPVFYEVEKGDSLWKIAEKGAIYRNPYKWTEIYYSNKEKIQNPDMIFPGTVLKIPRYFEMFLSSFEGVGEKPAVEKMKSPPAGSPPVSLDDGFPEGDDESFF